MGTKTGPSISPSTAETGQEEARPAIDNGEGQAVGRYLEIWPAR